MTKISRVLRNVPVLLSILALLEAIQYQIAVAAGVLIVAF